MKSTAILTLLCIACSAICVVMTVPFVVNGKYDAGTFWIVFAIFLSQGANKYERMMKEEFRKAKEELP